MAILSILTYTVLAASSAAVVSASPAGATTCSSTASVNPTCYSSADIIERDVAIIGGGSSGTYAAIALKDLGKSVVVVEKQNKMGGHVLSYHDPTTGMPLNYGVRLFENTTVTNAFFKRLNSPMQPYQPPPGAPTYADFKTGQILKNFTFSKDFTAYLQEFDKYPYLNPGQGYHLPNPVPEDLALPFGDFLKKHNLLDVAYASWSNPSLGDIGNVFQTPALYVMRTLTRAVLTQEGTAGKTLESVTGDNHVAWDHAQAELGSNVLLSTTVIAASRPAGGSTGSSYLVVKTPTGNKLIKAAKILFSAAQSTDNLKPFFLDRKESAVFSKLQYTGFYSGLVNGTGLPNNVAYQNAATSADTEHVPLGPKVLHFYPSEVAGIFSFWYESDTPLDDATVKSDIAATLEKLANSPANNLNFLAYANHCPGILYAPLTEIESGFWDKMNSLQGYRNTFYTGLLFEQSASGLWAFTKDRIHDMFA
ncbi:hypothetical protein VHEMI07284 [[Torrubiella] hemipterigena]|uniref:Amine oxidase domain-containing protein n=1 Tax=[Torrubiella] hemipterigena TaxID=1531966 RepID=A0A0A1TMM7_9HYPO|nr:hypothetical protein VHEMI07284 [[Torrubiella] hemipterigena]